MSSALRVLQLSLIPLVVAGPTDSPIAGADRDFVYIHGTLGIDPATGALAGGVAGQTQQAIENVRSALGQEGLALSHVVSVNVYLSDARLFREMNAAYRTVFPRQPPTRATVEVDLPMPGALVQIAVTAARPHIARRVIRPSDLRTPDLPYSWGILAGNTLFVAGATSRDPATYQPVTGDIGTQTRRVFGNIGAVLRAAGMDYGDLASCTVFLDDAREFGGMNAAYREFVGDDPPARATVRAKLMNPAFKVEIQCVAERGTRSVVLAAGATRPRSPYSPAIAVGDRLYLAGMVGSGAGGITRGDVGAQTVQTLANLGATLRAAGKTFGDVTSVQVYVPQIAHGRVADSIVRVLVGDRAPRTVIGADLMGPDLLVEIMMSAGGRAPL